MEKIIYYTNSGEFESEKLLPCPFCGGKPEFRTIGNEATKNRKAEIECTKCHVRRTTGAIRNSLEWCGRKAIEHWNARWQENSKEKIKCINELNEIILREATFGNIDNDVYHSLNTRIEFLENEL